MSIFASQYLVGPGVFVDVTDTAAFRTHLGLGSAALQASTAFSLTGHGHDASGITAGTMAVSRGGTGVSSIGAGSLVLGNGTSAVTTLGPGAANTVLLGQGTSSSPIMANLVGSGGITIAQVGSDLRIHSATGGDGTVAGFIDFVWDAAATWGFNTNAATLERVDGNTSQGYVVSYDDTVEEYRFGAFPCPSNLLTSGTVALSVVSTAKSATTGNMIFTFGQSSQAAGASFDAAYTEHDSSSTAVAASTSTLSVTTWSVSVASLGWVANDLIQWRWSRDPGDTVTGDICVRQYRIRVPVTLGS